MKKSVLFALVALVIPFSVNTTVVASESVKKGGDAVNGKVLSATCAACHGADGNSINPAWPTLAGQGEAYLLKQLQDFRSDERSDAVMGAQAKGIKSEADMADLVAYYATQKAKTGTAKEDQVVEGAAIYRGGVMASGVAACAACHGPTGEGNTAAKFPKLSGQHAKYTVAQLKAFKSGKRSNDTGKMMRNIALKMTDAEMEAVAEYIAGLHD